MVKIGYGSSTLEITELYEPRFGGSKKVGSHKRKSGGKTYESAKIVLDRHYKEFIGKKYKVLKGKAEYEYGHGSRAQMEGKCIVLFFPDKWNEESSASP